MTDLDTATARPFRLIRDRDVTGVSGTGVVADGVLWPDGSVSIRWRGDRPSAVFWDRLADAEAVHGHGGATRIVWAEHGQRNRLARQLADAADALDAATANYETTRDDLAAKSAEFDIAATWLDLIAERGCERFTGGPGSCTSAPGRWAVAQYEAYRWCDPCRAWAALNRVPMSTQPAEPVKEAP